MHIEDLYFRELSIMLCAVIICIIEIIVFIHDIRLAV